MAGGGETRDEEAGADDAPSAGAHQRRPDDEAGDADAQLDRPRHGLHAGGP